MPSIASITINDGKATPVAHIFTAKSAQASNQPALWKNDAASIQSGKESLTILVKEGKGAASSHVWEALLKMPVIATVNTVDTVIRTSQILIRSNFAPTSTLAERKDARTLAINLLSNANALDSHDNISPMY